jgi:hypothetical protein
VDLAWRNSEKAPARNFTPSLCPARNISIDPGRAHALQFSSLACCDLNPLEQCAVPLFRKARPVSCGADLSAEGSSSSRLL